MPKWGKYHPDYAKLYPGEEITPEVLESLKRSDRKMEYMEVDLKQGCFRQNAAEFDSSREISLDQLRDEEEMDFHSSALSPEEIAIHNDEIDRLCKALKKLDQEEYALMHTLFFEGISMRQYAKEAKIPLMTISCRKSRIQKKLKKLMES